jgi:GT2 family glycosyltransferase
MLDLSIILPTCNRARLLERALVSLWSGVSCAYEIIVVDGASDDETPGLLKQASMAFGQRLRIIREESREGFVRAANKGFRAARGRNLLWLNDDARPAHGALDAAAAQIDAASPAIGLLAMYHRSDVMKNVAYEALRRGVAYRLLHVRGTLYANFGIARREVFERLGYFDEGYYLNGADPDFSLKVWDAGLQVQPAEAVFIDHDEHADDRRADDKSRGQADNERLFAKWDLPDKNLIRNDFDPARPCTLRGLRRRKAA